MALTRWLRLAARAKALGVGDPV